MLRRDARSILELSNLSSRAQQAATTVSDSSDRTILRTTLSLIAGCTDVISFLGLGGLFTAHITGNVIMIAAHLADGSEVKTAQVLAVPIFILMLAFTRLLAYILSAFGITPLRPLLVLQFLLLSGFLTLGAVSGHNVDPTTEIAICAGMLGVAAMAVQNALVQISLRNLPSTAVMTTNITRLTIELVQVLVSRDIDTVAKARHEVKLILPTLVAFTAGAALGALCFKLFGSWSLVLPTGLALLAVLISNQADHGTSGPWSFNLSHAPSRWKKRRKS